MRLGRVGPDHDDDIAAVNRLEVLRPGRRAECLLRPKPVGEWQTHAQVSTLLLPKAGPHHLLHDEDLFVGATRGRDPAYCV